MSILAGIIVFIAVVYGLFSWMRAEIKTAIHDSEMRIRQDIVDLARTIAGIRYDDHDYFKKYEITPKNNNDKDI